LRQGLSDAGSEGRRRGKVSGRRQKPGTEAQKPSEQNCIPFTTLLSLLVIK
jgi:hypothetical protein